MSDLILINFVNSKKPYTFAPDIYAMGCPDKVWTEIILKEPDPVSTGGGRAKGFSYLIG